MLHAGEYINNGTVQAYGGSPGNGAGHGGAGSIIIDQVFK